MTDNNQIVGNARQNTTAEQPKMAYTAPTLRNYGSVTLLTSGMTGSGSDMMGMIMLMASDRNAKQNIVRIGEHPLGIGLYLFDYKPEYRDAWGHGRQMGVMADEVESIRPEAVRMHPDGYKMVNYGMLN